MYAEASRAARRRWPPPMTRCAVGGKVPPPRLSRFFPPPRWNKTPFSPRLRPRKEVPLACRPRLKATSGDTIVIDDANGYFFGVRAVARAFASRSRSVARGGGRFFLYSRVARPSQRARMRPLTNAPTPIFSDASGGRHPPRARAACRRAARARLFESGVASGCSAAPAPEPRRRRRRRRRRRSSRRRRRGR